MILEYLKRETIFILCSRLSKPNPAGIYLLRVNNKNNRARCEICSKLTIKTPERRHLYC